MRCEFHVSCVCSTSEDPLLGEAVLIESRLWVILFAGEFFLRGKLTV